MMIALLRDGRVVADFRTQGDGTFSASGLNPGPYSLVGIGQDGYVAFGVELLGDRSVSTREASQSGDVASAQILQPMEIDTLAVPPIDASVVLGIAQRHLPRELLAPGRNVRTAPVIETGESTGPPTARGTAPEAPAGAVFAEAQPPVPPLNDQGVPQDFVAVNAPPSEVRMAGDGSLSGSLRRLDAPAGQPLGIRNLTVFLVQDGAIVESAPVSPDGGFIFGSIPSGVYSFVAAGADGFAAFSVRVVDGSVASAEAPDELHVPVALVQANPAGLMSVLVMAADVPFAISQLAAATGPGTAGLGMPVDPYGPPGYGPGGGYAGGGGSGGGGFGGGGGYGFGSGLGTALGLAALGAAIAALVIAEDDDDDQVVATPF
jgi:hypothetical protein